MRKWTGARSPRPVAETAVYPIGTLSGNGCRGGLAAHFGAIQAHLGASLCGFVLEVGAYLRASVTDFCALRAIVIRAALHRAHARIASNGALFAGARTRLHAGHFRHLVANPGTIATLRSTCRAGFDTAVQFLGQGHDDVSFLPCLGDGLRCLKRRSFESPWTHACPARPEVIGTSFKRAACL